MIKRKDLVGGENNYIPNKPETLEEIERIREQLREERALFHAQQELDKELEEFRDEKLEASKETLSEDLAEMMERMMCQGLNAWKTKYTRAHTRRRQW